MTHPARLRGALAALLLSFAVTLGLAAPAGAAKVIGPTTFTFTGSAFSKQGIKVEEKGRAETFKNAAGPRLLLPTTDGRFRKQSTRVKHSGSLELRRKSGGKQRKIRISGLEIRLQRKSVVTARVGGKRMDLLSLDLRKRDYTVERSKSVVIVENARGTLTKGAAERIGRALKIKKVRRSSFAVVSARTSEPGATAPGGAGGSGAPAPQPTAPPATAAGLTAVAPLRWHVRESWIRYISTGEGTTASNGAVAGAPAPGGFVYDYDFASAPGSWFDAASGKGVFYFQGTLHFKFSGHGLDITISNPRVELDGSRSRIIATFGGDPTAFHGVGELATLGLAQASTAGTAAPNYVFNSIPVKLTPWANDAVFLGMYSAADKNDDFGSLNLGYTFQAP